MGDCNRENDSSNADHDEPTTDATEQPRKPKLREKQLASHSSAYTKAPTISKCITVTGAIRTDMKGKATRNPKIKTQMNNVRNNNQKKGEKNPTETEKEDSSSEKLIIVCWNIRKGLVTRELELKHILKEENIDVIFLTETDTKAITSSSNYQIEGYTTLLPDINEDNKTV